MNFLYEMKDRIKSKTPPFFKKLRLFAKVVTGICTPIVAIPTQYTGAVLPDIIVKICSYLLIAAVVIIATSSLTKDTSIDVKDEIQ